MDFKMNRIEIIKDTGKRNKDRNVIVLAKCHCGKIFETEKRNITKNRVKSCGCSRIKDYTNARFGMITVLEKTEKRCKFNNSVIWKCKCDCGKELELAVSEFTRPKRKSCGCDKTGVINACKSRAGKNHHWYKKEISDTDRRKRRRTYNYSIVLKTYKRDNYTCCKCKVVSTSLCAHHLDGYHWCKEKRFDLDNLVTLCVDCHKLFHKRYGKDNNTKEQFLEFMESKYESVSV